MISNLKFLLSAAVCFFTIVPSATARLFINEILTSNGSINMDPDLYNFTDWIEIRNDSSEAVDIGDHYLSDEADTRKKWRIPLSTVIPPNGFMLFWTDGLDSARHTNFKLSADGEVVLLCSPEGRIIDSVNFSAQLPDRSLGRDRTNPSRWCYFDTPTPGLPNNVKGLAMSIKTADPPQFSITGGFYNEPVYLTLSATNIGDTVRFTRNGAEPDSNSPAYNSPILLERTVVIRAKTFSCSLFNSQPVTHTYFIAVEHKRPVISLAINPQYLWNNKYGIYVVGTNGVVGFLGDTANYNRDWERPLNVEFYSIDKDRLFSERAGVEIVGLISRNKGLKSMSISLKGKYGNSEVECDFFSSRKTLRVKEFILRNSGGADLYHTHLRDGMMNNIVANRMDIDYQAYEPVVVYINGRYWGILNLREKLNSSYPEMLYNADPANLDFLETFLTLQVNDGDSLHYDNLIKYVSDNDMTNDESIQYVASKIDIPEFVNYHITQIYFLNIDWPANNLKMWRPRTSVGRWRWILSDVECGFNMLKETAPDQDAISRLISPAQIDTWAPPWSTLLFRKLMENSAFRHDFIQTSAFYLSTVFDSTRVVRHIDSTRNVIKPEIEAHIARWNTHVSVASWEDSVEVLKDFAEKRPHYALQHIGDAFSLHGTSTVSIMASGADRGRVEFNGRPLPSDTCQVTLFNNVPFSLKAVPAPGFRFVRWVGNNTSTDDSIRCSVSGASLFTAEFAPLGSTILPSKINSDMALSSERSPYYVGGDVAIDSNVTLTIGPGVTIYMGDSASFYIYGSLCIDGKDDRPVTLKPDSASGAKTWGALCFINTTSPSELRHVRLEGASISRTSPELFFASITAKRADISLENVFIESRSQPFYADYGDVVIRSSIFRSHATCDLINVKFGTAIVEDCDLSGNYAFDTDAIDYDGIDGGVIRRNRIHDFFGSNSDAIDLGEGSRDILIQDNLIYNCSDKGISLGQASTAIAERNTVLYCNLGVGVKDEGSFIRIDRNTFHGNRTAISCYEKNPGAGGGSAEVKNCIFSGSVLSNVEVDGLSSIDVSWSRASSGTLPGLHNTIGAPNFTSIVTGDFTLRPTSSCIDAGDPASLRDPDNTLADLGAHCFFQQVFINEISYKNIRWLDAGDWIELANSGKDTVDLGGWTLSTGDGRWSTTLLSGASLLPGDFMVMAGNRILYLEKFKSDNLLASSNPFEFDENGETLVLKDNMGTTVDSLSFESSDPWPVLSRILPQTLSLKRFGLDNMHGKNWSVSQTWGTPGRPNEFQAIRDSVVINEINYNPHPLFPTGDWIELHNVKDRVVDMSGWVLTDDEMSHRYVFPANTAIEPKGFLVVSNERENFWLFLPEVWNTTGDFDFGLGSGDAIRLFDSNGKLVDSVYYEATYPWPAGPDGSGATLELINPLFDNVVPQTWRSSIGKGTPGKINSVYADTIDTGTVEPVPVTHTELYQNYPNPFRTGTTISYSICEADTGLVHLGVYNLHGKLIKTLVHERQPSGFYRVQLTSKQMASGIYVCCLSTPGCMKTRKISCIR